MKFYNSTFADYYAPEGSIFANTTDPGDIILLIISIFVLVSGILSILFILRGGLLMILSGGKEEKITPALNTIRYAILGVIITVVTIFLFPILGRLLGLDVEKYAKPKRIFEKIEQIGNKVFGNSGGSTYVVDPNVGELPTNFANDL